MTGETQQAAEPDAQPGVTGSVDIAEPRGIGLTRAYRRLPAVEAEIATLPAPSASGFRAEAESAKAPETLVHAVRQLLRTGNANEARLLAEVLAERAAPIFTRAAGNRLFSGQSADIDDVAQRGLERFWQAIHDLSPQQEFWEVNFQAMVVRVCKDAARAYRARYQNERQFARGSDDDGQAWDEESNLADPQPLDDSLLVPEALDQLEGNVRRVVYLDSQGFKAASKNPGEITISRLLGISDRTVRTYLREGEATLRAWLASSRE